VVAGSSLGIAGGIAGGLLCGAGIVWGGGKYWASMFLVLLYLGGVLILLLYVSSLFKKGEKVAKVPLLVGLCLIPLFLSPPLFCPVVVRGHLLVPVTLCSGAGALVVRLFFFPSRGDSVCDKRPSFKGKGTYTGVALVNRLFLPWQSSALSLSLRNTWRIIYLSF
jgi:hypothetical protein